MNDNDSCIDQRSIPSSTRISDRAVTTLLKKGLTAFVHEGKLRVTMADGTSFTVGDGKGPPLAIRFLTHAAERAALIDPDLKFGECYMDGSLIVEEGTIADLMALALRQEHSGRPTTWAKPHWALRYMRRRLTQFNSRARSQKNVSHHYDLDGRLYSMFLDADRQYSCAYFEKPGQRLDDAQLAKKRHIVAKLMLEPGTACSISALAGVGWPAIWQDLAAPMSTASPCRRNNSRFRARRVKRATSAIA